jgi:hypothetical protein
MALCLKTLHVKRCRVKDSEAKRLVSRPSQNTRGARDDNSMRRVLLGEGGCETALATLEDRCKGDGGRCEVLLASGDCVGYTLNQKFSQRKALIGIDFVREGLRGFQ